MAGFGTKIQLKQIVIELSDSQKCYGCFSLAFIKVSYAPYCDRHFYTDID